MSDNTIDVSGEGLYEHEVGNVFCKEGWCDSMNFPTIHEKHEGGCKGLVHADFGDENGDGDYWIYTLCDKCGERD